MAYMGHATVDFRTPEEADEDRREYTVPIPEGLTEEFEPSRPVTNAQTIAFQTSGKEPYPGYAREYADWERAWQEVDDAQDEADGIYSHYSVLANPSPENDPITGDPIDYDELRIEENAETGDADLLIPEDELDADER